MSSYVLILAAFGIWSTFGLAVRSLEMSAPAIVFYNSLFGLAFQGAGLLYISRRESLGFGREAGKAGLLALFGLINVVTFFYAMQKTTIAAALLTHYTAPVFVAAIAPFLLKDRMGATTAAALFVSAVGLGLVFARGLGLGGGSALAGAAAGTVSGLAYAFVIILCRMLSGSHNPLKLAFFQCAAGLLLPGIYLISTTGIPSITPAQAVLFAAMGLLHTSAANYMYIRGVRDVTAQEAGVLGYSEPVFGILLAYMFLSETPHPVALAGGAMVIASGAAIVLQGARPEPAKGGE